MQSQTTFVVFCPDFIRLVTAPCAEQAWLAASYVFKAETITVFPPRCSGRSSFFATYRKSIKSGVWSTYIPDDYVP